MGQGRKRRRLAASTVGLAIFLILSSLVGNVLLARDATAGGMDVEWRVALADGYDQMLVAADGSVIVKGDHGSIEKIDRTGTVVWTFNSTQPEDLVLDPAGHLYFIERTNGQDTVNCLYSNGTLFWNLVSDVPVTEMRLGHNGDVYLVELRDRAYCLICMTGDGYFKWRFAPEGGVSSILTLSGGSVIARNMLSVWNTTEGSDGGFIKTIDNLTSIADDGSISWSRSILVQTSPADYLSGPFLGPNSTIDLYLVHGNGSKDITEIDLEGNVIGHKIGDQYTRSSYVFSDTIYVLENWQDISPNASYLMASRITAWNISTGALDWSSEQDGWVYLLDLNTGKGPLFQIGEGLALIGPNGEIVWNLSVNLVDWRIDDFDGSGMFLSDGHGTLLKADGQGRTVWKFKLDSRVLAGSSAADGRIIVMTNDYAISIHKAVLSTTMNYFVVLLAAVLFVTLMSAVWMVDMIWPEPKSRGD